MKDKKLEYIINKRKLNELEMDLKIWINNKCLYSKGTDIMRVYDITREDLEWNHYVYISKHGNINK